MAVTRKFIIIKNGVPLYVERMDYKLGGGREFFISDVSGEIHSYIPSRFDKEFMNDKKCSVLEFLDIAEEAINCLPFDGEEYTDLLTAIDILKGRLKNKKTYNPPLLGFKSVLIDIMEAFGSFQNADTESDNVIDYMKEAESLAQKELEKAASGKVATRERSRK